MLCGSSTPIHMLPLTNLRAYLHIGSTLALLAVVLYIACLQALCGPEARAYSSDMSVP